MREEALQGAGDRARATPDPLAAVLAARAARVAFGAVLVASGVSMVVMLLSPWPHASASVLLAAMPSALLAWLVLRLSLGRLPSSFWARGAAVGGGPTLPVAGLASPPDAAARRLAGRLERPSYTLPLAGLSLVMPLTLQVPFLLLSGRHALAHLQQWIALSVVLVGLAHLVLLARSVRFGRQLFHDQLQRTPEGEAFVALSLTILAGCLPGAFFLVPPVLVAVTGALFVPLSFALMARASRQERALLGLEHQRAEAVEVVEVARQG